MLQIAPGHFDPGTTGVTLKCPRPQNVTPTSAPKIPGGNGQNDPGIFRGRYPGATCQTPLQIL